MSDKKEEILETEELIDDFEDFDDGDYGFIISSNGELKSMMIPEDLIDEPPSKVRRILKMFGIKNIHQLEPRTLH
jgi:hypothetical protein